MPALVYSNDKSPSDWRYRGPDGKPGVLRVSQRLAASNGDVLREAAIAGLGIICLPNFLHYDAINNGLLQPVLTNYDWGEYDVYAVLPQDHDPAKADAGFCRFHGDSLWQGSVLE